MRRYISMYINEDTFDHYFLVTLVTSQGDCLAKDHPHEIWKEDTGMKSYWINTGNGYWLNTGFPFLVDKARREWLP